MGMDYPQKIKEYREKEFLSQSDLAKLLGVSFVTVNRWERGHFEPTIKCKKKLHALFVKAHIVEE
jgi:DNA-binding XRE family transcriptional regulator